MLLNIKNVIEMDFSFYGIVMYKTEFQQERADGINFNICSIIKRKNGKINGFNETCQSRTV